MKENVNDKCLAYLTGELDSDARLKFEAELATSNELQALVQRYREILALEQEIAAENVAVSPSFSVKVMEAVEQESAAGFSNSQAFLRYFAVVRSIKERFLIPLSAMSAVSLAVVIAIGIRDKKDISPQAVVSNTSTSVSIDKKIEKKVDAELEKYAASEQSPAELSRSESAQQSRTSVATAKGGNADLVAAPKQEWESREKVPTVKLDESDLREPTSSKSQPKANSADEEALGAAMKAYKPLDAIRIGGLKSKKDRDAYLDSALTLRGVSPEAKKSLDKSLGRDFSNAKRVDNYNSPSAIRGMVAEERAVASGELSISDEIHYGNRTLAPEPYPVAPPNTEDYGIYEENQRTQVTKEPRSTFSLDVDTGSFSNARRFLSMGNLPPQNSVRIEEFINYFQFSYPSQTDRPFGVHYEIAPSPFSAGRHLLKLGVKAKDAGTQERKPWNLVFLIDVSGSMSSENKLPLLKRSFEVLISNMRNEDRVAIVTYSGGTQVVLSSTPGSERERISAAINGLYASGSTNGSAGMELAYQEAEKFKSPDAVNRVILATDGDFNMGTTSFDGLVQLVESKRKTGITLTALGFGEANLKEKNLEQMADKGDGNYFYLDSFAEARKVLGSQLDSNMEVVAKDVKVQVEFNPTQVVEYRLLGYDNRRLANEDFANDSIDAGEIGAGHTVTAIYELVLAGSNLTGDMDGGLRYQQIPESKPQIESEFGQELAFVKIRFKAPGGTSSEKMQFPIEKQAMKTDFSQASEDFRFASAVAGFAQLLRGSKYASGYGYAEILSIAKSALGSDSEGQRRQFVELVSNAHAAKRH